MKEKKNEGITLIALVITIIVLLILAGVTLSTLFGNNGILTESQLAVETNKEANAKEQVQLAWMGCETEYQSAWTKDSNIEKSSYFQKENLNRNLGTGTVKSVNYVENGKSTVTYTLDGTEYEFEIANGQVYKVGQAPDVTQPEVTKGTLVQSVTKDNYGDTINYSANGISDWKIFYNDGDNVFIITSHLVPTSTLPNLETITKQTDYGMCWNDNVSKNTGGSAINETVAKKFMFNWLFKRQNITSNPVKAIEDLMRVETWNSFASGYPNAVAIGSPTIEMWIDSWNSKYENNKVYFNDGSNLNSDGSVYVDNQDYDGIDTKGNAYLGYLLGPTPSNGNTLSDYLELTGKTGIEDSLFFPDAGNESMGYGYYWLASSSSNNAECLYYVNPSSHTIYGWDSYVPDNSHGVDELGLRPVVCLPSSVNATKSGSNWIIEH